MEYLMLPQKLDLPKMQTTWAQAINPILANLLVQGQLLKSQTLINGTTAIDHKLGRQPQGWFLVAPQASAIVYQASQQLNPTLTLTLISNADLLTDIWVF
jgi:hypothetical protein